MNTQDQSAGGTALSSPLCTVTGVTADPDRAKLMAEVDRFIAAEEGPNDDENCYALLERARDQIVADGERIAKYRKHIDECRAIEREMGDCGFLRGRIAELERALRELSIHNGVLWEARRIIHAALEGKL